MSDNLNPVREAAVPPQVPSMSEGDWLLKMITERKAAQSTVIIIETTDIKRIHQILSLDYSRLLGRPMRVLVYNLQINRVFENNVPVETDVSQLQHVTDALISSPTVAITHYVFSKQHADYLSDFLLYVAQNERLYSNMSTVIVITSDSLLFPEVVLEFSIVPERNKIMPTENERRTLITSLISEFSQKIPINVNNVEEIVQNTKGLTLHAIESIALKSIYEKQAVDVQYFTNYKIELLRKMGLSYIIPKRGFESIGGYDYLKNYIRSNIIDVLKNPSDAKELGLTIPKGIVLFGPPGTGKTWIAKALAKEIGLPMVTIDAATFLKGIVGETERTVKSVFGLIEAISPVIVHIDEFDQLAPARTSFISTDSNVTKRMENMMLSYFGDENRQSFLIATTNLVSDIDPAFLRPGRVDEIMVVLPPDLDARKQILQVHTSVIRKIPLSEDVDFNELAGKTFLWTGAELEKLVFSAARNAFQKRSKKVTMQDFIDAFNSIEINISEREKTVQRVINDAKRLENINKKFLNEALKVFANDASKDERVKSLLAQLK
jgi:ATP-dependent 26S proteasome regulatory subunit